MAPEASLVVAPDIAQVIYPIRDQRVILDVDLARIYGVPTKALNQAVKRNAARFPTDFMFRLTVEEAQSVWRSRSQFVTLKRGYNLKYLPQAFTEHGALMAANILNSPRAASMSVYVIRAFVRTREERAANLAIQKRLAEIDKMLLVHDAALRDIFQKLRPLLEPPPLPPKPEIGFHVREAVTPYRTRRNSAFR
jgi:hypothetical protein